MVLLPLRSLPLRLIKEWSSSRLSRLTDAIDFLLLVLGAVLTFNNHTRGICRYRNIPAFNGGSCRWRNLTSAWGCVVRMKWLVPLWDV